MSQELSIVASTSNGNMLVPTSTLASSSSTSPNEEVVLQEFYISFFDFDQDWADGTRA